MRAVWFVVCLGALSGCGLFHRDDIGLETAYGKSTSDSSINPVETKVRMKDVPKSHYEICLDTYEGYPNVETLCEARMKAGQPGQLPVCGSWYAWDGPCRQVTAEIP